MTEPKKFEDLFVHDSNTVYDDEDDDLGPDDEFAGKPKKTVKKNKKRPEKIENSSEGGCFKYLLLATLIAGGYFYYQGTMPAEEKSSANEQAVITKSAGTKSITQIIEESNDQVQVIRFSIDDLPDSPVPAQQEPVRTQEQNLSVKTMDKKPLPAVPAVPPVIKPAVAPVQETPSISLPNSKGRGSLPDLLHAAQSNQSLKTVLQQVSDMELKDYYLFRPTVETIIFKWADVENYPDSQGLSERKAAVLEKLAGQPLKRSDELIKVWNKYVQMVSFDLFAQTAAAKAGISAEFNKEVKQVILPENPINMMADLYPGLSTALEGKEKNEKLKTIEPASSFFLRTCGHDIQCLASYDLLIDSFGLMEYANTLQTAPEQIYSQP